jgi:hypothetical protein
MEFKNSIWALSLLALSACGGGGGTSISGSGQIDYDSPTVVADLQLTFPNPIQVNQPLIPSPHGLR